MAVGGSWLTWVQGDSVYTDQAWTIHALDLATGEQRTLATSELPDGSLLFGELPQLAMRGGVVTWAQPTSTSGPIRTAQVEAYDLDAGRVSVLDRGRVSSPVFAGPLLVWGAIDPDGATVFRAINAVTHQPAQLPVQVRNQPGILYLAGSSQYLVWSTDLHTAVAWNMDEGLLTTYAIPQTGDFVQFLSIAGNFMIWFPGSSWAVLDLRTGGAFDAATYAGGTLLDQLAGSQVAIVRAQPQPGGGKGPGGTTIFSLPTGAAPSIPGPAS
jgi:hypothetical protein